MIGICAKCKKRCGDGEKWGMHFWEGFPISDCCQGFVFLDE